MTVELFQKAELDWESFRETGWSAYGLFRAHRYHFENMAGQWNVSKAKLGRGNF